LEREDLAEFQHQPSKANRLYRFVVLRKKIVLLKGRRRVGSEYRYFFYITNDSVLSQEQVVSEANHRCNQENLLDQLKNGVRALHAPLNTLEANWAYMVIASLAWSLKAWATLLLPFLSLARKHLADRECVSRMEFRSFVQRFILVPAQILRSDAGSSIDFSLGDPSYPSSFGFSMHCDPSLRGGTGAPCRQVS
jgi:hypothetical protein